MSHYHISICVRVLRWAVVATVLVVVLLTGLVTALPAIVSSPAVQSRLQRALGTSLKRTVSWASMDASWTRGVSLNSLAFGPGPAPLLAASVGGMAIVPALAYRDGRVRVDLNMSLSNISAHLAPGPPQPPKPYKEPLTALSEAVQRFQGMNWPLPFDIGVRVRIEPGNIDYTDSGTGRRLTLTNFLTRLDMPSLADQPVRAEVQGDLAVDGHRLERIELFTDLQQLVTAGRRLRPAGALVSLKGHIPGSSLALQGGLESPEGFTARGRLDLRRLMAAAGPFLPPNAPAVQGEVGLGLQARIDAGQNLQAALVLDGSRIALSGGRLKQGRVGPFELRLAQKFVSDRQREQVRFTDGQATIGTLLDAAWEATVDRPSRRDRDLTARLGPVRVDLHQALAVAGPLLPPKFPVRELAGELVLQRLGARLQGRANRGEISIVGLGVALPRLRIALAKGGVAADGVDVAINRATLPLESMRPTSLDAALSWGVRHAAVAGPQPLQLDGGRGGLQVTVRDLDLKSSSPRKIAASVGLRQSLDLQRINLERKLTVSNVNEQLAARILARESGEIEVTQPELKLTAASLQATAGTRQLQALPLSATLAAAGVRVSAVKGATPVVDRASLAVNGGDFLKLAATVGVGTAPLLATTEGTLTVDLGRILPLAAPFLPKGAAAGGVSSLAWKLAAPLKPQPFPSTGNPLARAKAASGLIERGEVAVSLANRGVVWPLAKGTIRVDELRTPQPLRLVLPGSSGKITVGGSVTVAGLTGLPGAAGQLPAQSGSLSLKGELVEWRSLRLHEELQLQTLGLVQQADATVSRLDALLEKPETVTVPMLLQRLDAVLSTNVVVRFPDMPPPVPGGLELSGEGRIGVRAELAAGRELRLRGTAATRGLGLRLKDGTAVEGMTADLLFDRTYLLAREQETGWTPLSASLVRPLPPQGAATGGAELANRVREDLRGQVKGSRRFTIRRVTLAGPKVPLVLTALEGDLLLTPEEMGLSFFQTELLGGTVRLRGMFDLRPELPAFSAACSFSNLETDRLLPPDVRQKSLSRGETTAVTGEVSLDAPLATGQRELLEGVRMRLNLRRIGRETLERALFSLDPYERNEQVVAQRKLLRNGNLNWLRAGTLDGSFSLEGEVQVKGINVTLPPVERIRLADLPLRKQLATTLNSVKKLRDLLDLVRADTIRISPDGKISLRRRNNE